MANSTAKDLMSIGENCCYPGCGKLDFLPFKCDACKRTFCLEHRSYEAHQCPNAKDRASDVIICPICAKGIRIKAGENVHQAFERHSEIECDPTNYDRVHNKPRCPVKGCREKLTEANTFRCKHCNKEFCMRHRFQSDHECTGQKATRTQTRIPNPGQDPYHTILGRRAQAVASSIVSSVRSSAQSLANSFQAVTSSAQGSGPQASSAGREVCPRCSARFDTVEDLILHVSVVHDNGSSRSHKGAPCHEECPYCGESFTDSVQFARHVKAHEYQFQKASSDQGYVR